VAQSASKVPSSKA